MANQTERPGDGAINVTTYAPTLKRHVVVTTLLTPDGQQFQGANEGGQYWLLNEGMWYPMKMPGSTGVFVGDLPAVSNRVWVTFVDGGRAWANYWAGAWTFGVSFGGNDVEIEPALIQSWEYVL